jgi:hypothetical protein
MRQVIAWDGPAPYPGDYLAGRGADECWRITGIARLPKGGRLSLDMQKASRAAMPARAVMHAWSRLASHDADGPARVRQVAAPGPTAVMRSEWRDPDDVKPNASHRPREITGYRTFCPLRRMMTFRGSEIDQRMILAADMLRGQVDIAVIGKGARSMEGVRQGYGPVSGPPGSALAQVKALTQARRALARLAPATRLLVAEVVLFNRAIQAWCHLTDPARNAQVEMGKLLAALEVLVDHYAAEIDEALSRGRMLEVA